MKKVGIKNYVEITRLSTGGLVERADVEEEEDKDDVVGALEDVPKR
jgi:hypothetical protein